MTIIRAITAVCCLLVLIQSAVGRTVNEDSIEVRLPEGFSIQQVADDSVATNIFCMTTDLQGRVYVSGPGYIRRLVDHDDDGRFETSVLFSSVPQSGAQGMWFGETSMLFTGDGAIWRLQDLDRDGVADGEPEKLLPIKTGSEHLAHAIRQGPDGWFYILAGNNTPILEPYHESPWSPVANPRAGFLMRLSPDFKTGEVVANGFRNAYDFDFNRDGRIFVYDSDGERDISLPWYRPTRVYQIQPGDDAGWLSAGWKRPSSYFDMPEELGEFGRGSPTGVECYRGNSYPSDFDNAIFVADWTFGRIHVFKQDQLNGKYDRGSEFAISDGQFGFAVTDLTAAHDGSLLVSVGGRGTSGAVYRITYEHSSRDLSVSDPPAAPLRRQTPFNLRESWTPEELAKVLEALHGADENASLIALECLVGRAGLVLSADETNAEQRASLIAGIRKQLELFDGQRAKLVLAILRDWSPDSIQQMDRAGLPRASVQLLALAALNRELDLRPEGSSTNDAATVALIASLLDDLESDTRQADVFCRLGQLALGDVGLADSPEMFKGYTANRLPSSLVDEPTRFANRIAGLLEIDRESSELTRREIGRLAGMLKANSPELQRALVACLTISESPIDAIHWLNCLAQASSIETAFAADISQTLVELDQRIADAGLPTDRNWVPRMRQLCDRLFACQPAIATEVAAGLKGRDGQVFLFDELPSQYRPAASERFLAAIEQDLQRATPDQLRIAAAINSPAARSVLRSAAEFRHLKEAAMLALAVRPEPQDRKFYRAGLGLGNPGVASRCAVALMRFAGQPDSAELLAAFKVLQQSGWDKQDAALRDQMVRLMQHQTGQLFGYQFNQKNLDQSRSVEAWAAYLRQEYPDDFQKLLADDQRVGLLEELQAINWAGGDADRGLLLYRDLKCAQCHDGGSRLGPRLDGVSKRFSRTDLFRSIVAPSGQVPDRYRATVIETVDGLLYRGTVIYESVDGVTLQDVNGTTLRINQSDIESKTLSAKSLMPEGLLDGLKPQEWADLYAYLTKL